MIHNSPLPLLNRQLIAVCGADRFTFLQGLLTQDMRLLEAGGDGLLYTAMLSPQGKILFDGLLHQQAGEECLWLEVASAHAELALTSLKRYKLRAKVTLEIDSERMVSVCLDENAPDSGTWQRDPRHAGLGYRHVNAMLAADAAAASPYHHRRIELGIAEGEDFAADKAYIAEYGIDQLHGVSFSKGCYVGQEIVARMKYRATLRKILHCITSANGSPLPASGTAIMAGEKKIGELRASSNEIGLAILNRDKLKSVGNAPLMANTIPLLQPRLPDWFTLADNPPT